MKELCLQQTEVCGYSYADKGEMWINLKNPVGMGLFLWISVWKVWMKRGFKGRIFILASLLYSSFSETSGIYYR